MGPYAILVLEHGLSRHQMTGCGYLHDYLGTPEIVQQICGCFSDYHDFDLLTAYEENTTPTVVKFLDTSPQSTHPDCQIAALFHLYRRRRGFECFYGMRHLLRRRGSTRGTQADSQSLFAICVIIRVWLFWNDGPGVGI